MARPGWPERNRAARSFRQLRRFHHVINSDEVFGTHTGVEIVRKALSAPARQIAINAGEDGSIVVGNILSGMKPDFRIVMANFWHDAKLTTLGDIAEQHQVKVPHQLADFGLDRPEALPDAYWTEGLKEGANHQQLKLIADDVMAHRFSVLAKAKRISSREPDKPGYGFGYDAAAGDYVDMFARGVIDPAKVVRAAIQNAASVASLIVTTEALVAELPKKAAATPGAPAGGMGGMDF